MSGQKDWKDAGTGVNDYVVKEEVVRGVYYAALAASVFGGLNEMRNVDTKETIHGGGKQTIKSGKDSPVFEKTLDQNNTALFTMEEEYAGMPTYGDAEVAPGEFPSYMHSRIEARQVKSPAFPVWEFESRHNFKRVVDMSEIVSSRRPQISKWMEREFDLDAFRALYMGLSRGLWDKDVGGKGTSLTGTTDTVRTRVPWNTFVAGHTGLTAQNVSAEVHNQALATALSSMLTDDTTVFNYGTHELIGGLVDQLGIRAVKVGGKQYRAVVLTDPRNAYAIRRDRDLRELWMMATPRDTKNPAIYSRGYLELDDILYLPVQIMKWFRPTVDYTKMPGNWVAFGCSMDKDPRASDFTNNSPITTSIVLGAGALRRGRRYGEAKFTSDTGRHGDGLELAVRYDDGWMRNEWYYKDNRDEQTMFCDSSFMVFNHDTGPSGVSV